ncbi:hypothetical protein BZU93_30285, partial [Salmonella enterica subsp. enterica]|nr:hypothetical protein [Salmonella enterica subsp. enterica serovar Enteritidis]
MISIQREIVSDDPKYVHRLYVKPQNGPIYKNNNTDIYNRLKCGETETHMWEDGGSYRRVKTTTTTGSGRNAVTVITGTLGEDDYPSKSNPTIDWKAGQTDFEYTITGRCSYTTSEAR